MTKPKMIGSINCYVVSCAWFGTKKIHFDGTIKGLTIAAIAAGAKVGTRIKANFGGTLKSDTREMTLISTPHDLRASGFWCE